MVVDRLSHLGVGSGVGAGVGDGVGAGVKVFLYARWSPVVTQLPFVTDPDPPNSQHAPPHAAELKQPFVSRTMHAASASHLA
jgi:hypothetical protein